MKQDYLAHCIGNVNVKYIEEAESYRKKNKNIWVKLGTAAACLCLIAVGMYAVFHRPTSYNSRNQILQWSAQFLAKDYFKYNNGKNDDEVSSSIIAEEAIKYAETRSFTEERRQFENEGVIPFMNGHPLFNCTVNYNDDGSIYSLNFSWHKRGNIDDYSDLSITAGYREVEIIEDCIFIELDENGNVVTPAVTVTERDGIQIVAKGSEKHKKTITFQNGSGWYQVEGSWNDSYENMVTLLDWVWEHPIDFDRFPMDAGDEFTSSKIEQNPHAFSGYIPDFEAFDFVEEWNGLTLKNGEPYSFEANYVAHADAELVRESEYYNIGGWTNIHWRITVNPDYYDIRDSLGELHELTEQIVSDKLKKSSNIAFTWNGYFIRIYSNTSGELWSILETLQ